jgi:hypothetical protein
MMTDTQSDKSSEEAKKNCHQVALLDLILCESIHRRTETGTRSEPNHGSYDCREPLARHPYRLNIGSAKELP